MIDALPTLATLPGALSEPVPGDAAPGFAALLAAELPSTEAAAVALLAKSADEAPLALVPAALPAPSLRPGRLFPGGVGMPGMLQLPSAAASRPTLPPVLPVGSAATGLPAFVASGLHHPAAQPLGTSAPDSAARAETASISFSKPLHYPPAPQKVPERVSATLVRPADEGLVAGAPPPDDAVSAAPYVVIAAPSLAEPIQLKSATDDLPPVLRTDAAASAGHALHFAAPLAARNPLLPGGLPRVAPAMPRPLAAVTPILTVASAPIPAKNTALPGVPPQPRPGTPPPAAFTRAPTAPAIAAALKLAVRTSTTGEGPKVALATGDAAAADAQARDEPTIGDTSLLPASAVAIPLLDAVSRLLMSPDNAPVPPQTPSNVVTAPVGLPSADRKPALSAVLPGLSAGQPATADAGFAPALAGTDALAAATPAAAILPARISHSSPSADFGLAGHILSAAAADAPVSVPPLPVAKVADGGSVGTPAPTPATAVVAGRSRQPLPYRDELRLETDVTDAPQTLAAPDRGFAAAAPLPRSQAASASGLHPAATPPPQPLVISSDTLGAVTVGLDGGPQDLRLRLDAGPLAVGLLAAESPRLIADLAAQGVRLHALEIGGQTLNPTLIPVSSPSPGTGFGQQPQGQQPQAQHRHRSPSGMPTPTFRADPGASVPPLVSDRYA